MPVKERSWINSKLLEKLNEIKFQGKPPNRKLLIYSKKDKDVVKIKIDKIFFFGFKNEKAKVEIP